MSIKLLQIFILLSQVKLIEFIIFEVMCKEDVYIISRYI